MKTVLVVTPTTGSPDLADAAESVLNQTYPTEYLVVADGPQFVDNTNTVLEEANITGLRVHRLNLPFNTGGNGFYGHRIMSAVGHLVPHDYILFLDQDNWFDPTHVESLIDTCETKHLNWAYSLRKICKKDKQFVCIDNCESLGKWPVYENSNSFLIDSSSYCFSRQFFCNVGHLWHHGWGADRRFYTLLKEQLKTKYDCTNQFTLNYRLGGNEGSVKEEYFIYGNAVTALQYNQNYPWVVDKTVPYCYTSLPQQLNY